MKLTLDSWHELCGEAESRAQSIWYESSREAAGEDAPASRGPNTVVLQRPGEKTQDHAGGDGLLIANTRKPSRARPPG
jgi:hypothetical protein